MDFFCFWYLYGLTDVKYRGCTKENMFFFLASFCIFFFIWTRGNNPDSLFQTFDPEERQRAISNALQYARDVKQRVQDDVHYYEGQELSVRKCQIEWHRKFTLSFACFIFFFIGAPLGAIIRKGGLGMPVVVSVLLFIIYYIISMMGERSAREAAISPAVGMWISAFILLPLGIVLTYKSVTDSEMMSTESYKMFFTKLLKRFKKK